MKNRFRMSVALVATAIVVLASCEPERVVIQSGEVGFEGYHVGYSWAGEASGTALKDATSYIETILRLDEDARILDASMRYWQRVDGYWTTRQAGNALVSVNFGVNPTAATLGNAYRPGQSMFSIYTVNPMSLWAVAVSPDGTSAVALVEPLTRYRFEMKFGPSFDYRTTMGELTLDSGLVVPTVRTASGAWLNPADWAELATRHIFALHRYSHVMNQSGTFEGINANSSVRVFLQAMGVEFSGDRPQPMAPKSGYFGIGGWRGNYDAIARYLIGKNARSVTSLVDWVPERYRNAINDRNQFGIDVSSGATRTVQDSADGIAGATVRMSRESTSYQRALVDAGVLTEDDVIIGRF